MKKVRKIAAVALGCAKNRVDTEEILGLLGRCGYLISSRPAEADAVIVNTCAFIEAAQQESIDTILSLAARRRGGKPLLIAAGCLAQRYGGELLKAMPDLGGVIGVHSYQELPAFMESCFAGKRELLLPAPPALYSSLGARLLTTAPHSAYVKIAEGCSNHCRYCLIPSLRGPLRSRPAEEIITEIGRLIDGGAREINLIAQDTTAYGAEWGAVEGLSGLVKQILDAVPAFFRMRILYAHPARVSDSLIDLIARERRLCKYLDIPLQHINSDLLKRMGRRYSREEIVDLVGKLRRRIPGITLRTTYLTGYPGERPAHFRELRSFMQQQPFERVGVFAYSRQPGTAAADLGRQIPTRVSERRRRDLLAIQQTVAHSFNRSLVGRTFTVLLEGPAGSGGLLYCGRTEFQAPEVDGLTYVRSLHPLRPGDFVDVLITAAAPYDLYGTILKAEEGGPAT